MDQQTFDIIINNFRDEMIPFSKQCAEMVEKWDDFITEITTNGTDEQLAKFNEIMDLVEDIMPAQLIP